LMKKRLHHCSILGRTVISPLTHRRFQYLKENKTNLLRSNRFSLSPHPLVSQSSCYLCNHLRNNHFFGIKVFDPLLFQSSILNLQFVIKKRPTPYTQRLTLFCLSTAYCLLLTVNKSVI